MSFYQIQQQSKKSNAQKAKEVVRVPKNIDFTGVATVGELVVRVIYQFEKYERKTST
jgi:hypothetical protein